LAFWFNIEGIKGYGNGDSGHAETYEYEGRISEPLTFAEDAENANERAVHEAMFAVAVMVWITTAV
jgi:hypothetical protein